MFLCAPTHPPSSQNAQAATRLAAGARFLSLPVAAELPNRVRHIGPSERDSTVMLKVRLEDAFSARLPGSHWIGPDLARDPEDSIEITDFDRLA